VERRQTGIPAGKLSAALSADLREQTIQQLMQGDGVPRWKAEQMVGSSQSLTHAAERNIARNRQLREELDGTGCVGQAFKRLCDAGCDAVWLEHTLFSLQNLPLKRKRKAFNASDRKQLRRIAQNLEYAGRELNRFRAIMLTSKIQDWPVPVEELPSIVEGIGYCLKRAVESRNWNGLVVATASFRLPYMIAEVKHSTGRPHYAEMATLIGAAYGRPDYSEGELKMLLARTRNARRRK